MLEISKELEEFLQKYEKLKPFAARYAAARARKNRNNLDEILASFKSEIHRLDSLAKQNDAYYRQLKLYSEEFHSHFKDYFEYETLPFSLCERTVGDDKIAWKNLTTDYPFLAQKSDEHNQYWLKKKWIFPNDSDQDYGRMKNLIVYASEDLFNLIQMDKIKSEEISKSTPRESLKSVSRFDPLVDCPYENSSRMVDKLLFNYTSKLFSIKECLFNFINKYYSLDVGFRSRNNVRNAVESSGKNSKLLAFIDERFNEGEDKQINNLRNAQIHDSHPDWLIYNLKKGFLIQLPRGDNCADESDTPLVTTSINYFSEVVSNCTNCIDLMVSNQIESESKSA